MTLALQALRPDGPDYAAFVDALTVGGLPIDDLGDGGRFFALHNAGELVGFGGLDGAGPNQMIRSIVISPTSRGRGYGQAVVQALVEQAKAAGAERLWLLTTSAKGFFAGLGWAEANRASAPDPIRTSRQFAGLCPSSAVLMCRRLA